MDQEELIINTTKRVAKNTGALIAGTIISKLCLLALFAIAARYIGVAGFGKYTFALSFTALFTILGDMGLNMLAIREVARDRFQIHRYLGNVAILKTILSLVAVGIIFLAINFLNYPSDTTKVVYIIGSGVFFLSLSQALRWCFQAFQKMEYEALVNIAEGVIMLGFGFPALYLGKGVIGLAWAYFLTYIIIFIFSFLIIIKKFAKPKFEIDFSFWKYLMKAAIPVGLATVFFTIYSNLDTVLLSLMKGDEPVGWYNAGYKLVNTIRFFPTMFFWAIFPVMSEFYKSSIESLKKVFRKSIQYLFLLILPAGVGTTILAPKIIPLFFGEGFEPAILVLQILIWVVVLISLSRVATYCLVAIDKQKITIYIFGIGLVINIILNLILIPKFSYIGAAIAIITAEFIILLLALFFIVQNLKVNPFPAQVFKVIMAALLMGLLTWFLKDFNIILVVSSSAIFYFAILITLKGITQSDLKLIRQIIPIK